MLLKRLKQTGRMLFVMRRYPVEEEAMPSTFEEQIYAQCLRRGDVRCIETSRCRVPLGSTAGRKPGNTEDESRAGAQPVMLPRREC